MATLEKHGSDYRIDFYFGGKRFRRTVKTESEKAVLSILARAEDTLRRLTLGQLVLPPGADVASFVLSDGRLEKRQSLAKHTTLGSLLDAYRTNVTNLEETTEHCVKIHSGHFRRVIGERFNVRSMDLAALQRYVDTRSTSKGLWGKTLSSTTIKKELGTLGMIWSWALSHEYVDRPLAKKGLRFPKSSDKPPFQTMEDVTRKIAAGELTDEEVNDLWDSVFLTLAEIEEFLKHVKKTALHDCLYPMFVFAAHTGARRSEIRRTRIDDLDFGGKRVFLRERKRVRGRHTLRSVPMSPALEQALKAWLEIHPGGRHTFRLG